jgi:hypothetical protein
MRKTFTAGVLNNIFVVIIIFVVVFLMLYLITRYLSPSSEHSLWGQLKSVLGLD